MHEYEYRMTVVSSFSEESSNQCYVNETTTIPLMINRNHDNPINNRIVLAIPMKRASINFTNKILRWYKEQLSFTMIGNLEMSWQWESKVNRKENIESNHYRGLYRMDYNSDPIQKYRVYATVNYMLRIIMIENSLLSCWKYCRSLLLCKDDMIHTFLTNIIERSKKAMVYW